jgi:hypothetical protein
MWLKNDTADTLQAKKKMLKIAIWDINSKEYHKLLNPQE